jgi:predicted porin
MTRKKLILAGALGLASVAGQAQTTQDLQQALAQAQAAAAQAQAAAKAAQAALEQALAAADQAKKSSASASTVSAQATPGQGLSVSSGANTATLYGLIDITLFSKNHADKAGDKAFSPGVAWFSGNRWGLTGSHSTGGPDDLKAIFKLESEFESQTGNMDTDGVLFNRDAWLGLESKSLGKLTFGRQNALARDPAASAVYGDPYGPDKAGLDEGGYTNNNNFKQLIFYAGSATGTRYDRGVVWKKDWGNVVSGLAYQFAGKQEDPTNSNHTVTGSLAYNGPNFTVAGFATQADVAGLRHRSQSVGGNLRVTPIVRLNAGYYHYTAQQGGAFGDRHDNAWTLSAKLAPSKEWDYELGYQVMSAKNAGTNGTYVKNAFADTSGIKGVATGKRKTLYGSIFYHLDKQTEFYLAADRLNTTGTYKASQANGFTSQTELGLGMRYKF